MINVIFYAAIGVYIIVFGIRILVTGRLNAREEERLEQYTEKSVRAYKLVSAVVSILVGLVLIGEGVLKLLVLQKIIESEYPIFYFLLGTVIVLIGIIVIARLRCKKK